ncbi:MAG: HypC/HybG/HupF family hydrogenase formation chaperone [Chloroflexota bacterium]
MCQAIPRLVLRLEGERALVQVDHEELWVDARAVPDLSVGEHVVVYAGAVLERMSEEDASDVLGFYADLERLLEESAERVGLG